MAFEFHYRFNDEGGCDVICTRCFSNVGYADGLEAKQLLTAAHVCHQKAARLAPLTPSSPRSINAVRRAVLRYTQVRTPSRTLIALTVLSFYVLPTLLEALLSRDPGKWLACLLIGDLAGCLGIFFLLKRQRTAILLYLILTCAECSLYAVHLIPMQTLAFFMDAVPTLFLATQISQSTAERA